MHKGAKVPSGTKHVPLWNESSQGGEVPGNKSSPYRLFAPGSEKSSYCL